MKIPYTNLNVLNIRCDERDNTKEQLSCFSIAVPSKTEWTEWLGKKKRNQHERYYKDFYCLLACSSKMRNLK